MVTSATRYLAAPVMVLTLGAGAGCAHRSQAASPPPAALNVPPAPPRVISVPPEPVLPVETTTAEPSARRPPARATRPAGRPDSGAPRPGQAADPETSGPVETPVEPAVEPAVTAPLLRTPQTRDESQADKRIRDVLGRASTQLAQVNPASLSREARTQHDTARRFVDQANAALLERNFVFASYLADKAETLARGLSR